MGDKHLRRKPKRKPVTLIVGIICRDGIVMAADSQTTWETGKSWSTIKMTELRHPGGLALIAEAGADITSGKVVEQLKDLAVQGGSFEQHSLPELAAVAVKKVRDKLREQQFSCSSEEFQEFLLREGLGRELMLAHYEGHAPFLRSPCIDTIKLSLGLANRARGSFETIGSGADLANYLLTDLWSPEMDCATASLIAVLTVEIAKRHDPYCGGPARLGILRYPSAGLASHALTESETRTRSLERAFAAPIILSQSDTDEIVKLVSEVESSTKAARAAIIQRALADSSKQRMEQLMNLYELDDPLKPPSFGGYPKK